MASVNQNTAISSLTLAIDQGTSSTRCSIWNHLGECLASHQIELQGHYPSSGWMEHDPVEILDQVYTCIEKVVKLLVEKKVNPASVKAVGITNQRETTVVWDKTTGRPLHNAIASVVNFPAKDDNCFCWQMKLVWQDTRTASTVDRLIHDTPTQDMNYFQKRCGLPFSTYFSALKLRWMLDNIALVREEASAGRCLCGTIDSWLIWNMTGRTHFCPIKSHYADEHQYTEMGPSTLQYFWLFLTNEMAYTATTSAALNQTYMDAQFLFSFFGVPMAILPEIRSSAEVFGTITSGPLLGIPITAVSVICFGMSMYFTFECLGDQHAALVGQKCFKIGEAKNTYGTGCFLLSNVGSKPVFSRHGLLTTVAYKLGPRAPCVYALEGSIAVAGTSVRWLRDNLGIISNAAEVESLAKQVDSSHGVYFVPAFSGLLAPHWRYDARGIIIGLTQYSTKAHIARATLEAVSYQTREVLEAMAKDCGCAITSLRVDGGMTANKLLMQIQADVLGVNVLRPANIETTSWGAALAAGLYLEWPLSDEHARATTFYPEAPIDERDEKYEFWKRAVARSIGWTGESSMPSSRNVPIQESNPTERLTLPAIHISTLILFLATASALAFTTSKLNK
eukprot:gene9976-2151_t